MSSAPSNLQGLRLLSLGMCASYCRNATLPLSDTLLDGGGIRGLSVLLILKQIMYLIQQKDKLSKMPLPCEYFDLIGGTSTGGYYL